MKTLTPASAGVGKISIVLVVALVNLVFLLANLPGVLCDHHGNIRVSIDVERIKVENKNLSTTYLPQFKLISVSENTSKKAETLKQILLLSPFRQNQTEKTNNESRAETCYTQECLDAALDLLKSIDFHTDPCNDFYQFACGRWIANNPVPTISSRWNNLEVIRQKVKEVTQAILESPNNASELNSVKQAREFYAMCTDKVALEKSGVAPLLEILEPYGGWPAITPDWNPERFDVNKAIADGFRVFLQEIILTIDLLKNVDNSQYLLVLNKPDEFFLPSSYLENPEKFKEEINAYKTYFVSVAKELAKSTGAEKWVTDTELLSQVEDVIRFETRLVMSNESDTYTNIKDSDQDQVLSSNNGNFTEASENRHKANQPRAELNMKILLDHLFSSSGVSIGVEIDKNSVSIDEEYVSNLTTIIRSTDVRTIANYFTWRLISTFSLLTTNTLRDLELQFDKAVSGLLESESRETTCASVALGAFGMAITYKYVEENFDVNAKSKVTDMVEGIQQAFMEHMNESSWMDSETKIKADRKMKEMKKFVAYPDWLFNKSRLEKRYEGLSIVPGDSFRTIMGYLYWDANKTLNLLCTIPEVHINTWVFTPSTLRVFYRPSYNSITIPARILQPPMYRNKGLESLNYGGIGTTIGHEMTHGFDLKGSQFDFEGSKKNWWTPKTLHRFRRRASCFVEQYNDLKTSAGPVDGKSTRYENIGDNVGIRQSFLAYQNWIQENNGGKDEPRLPGLENFTSQQLFFLGYANSLCESVTEKGLQNQLVESTFSPARFRVQVPLQNFQKFAHHWDCPSGSPMNPPSEDRCVLL